MSDAAGGSRDYTICHGTDDFLDKDGKNVLMPDASDVVLVKCASAYPRGVREEMRVPPSAAEPVLRFARSYTGNREPLSVMYIDNWNVLITGAEWLPAFEDAVVNAARVTARFPAATEPYVLANLRLVEVFGGLVDFGASEFYAVRPDHQHIHATRVCRGQRPQGTLVDYEPKVVTFATREDYAQAQRAQIVRTRFVPKRLVLTGETLPAAFNFGSNQTLFRDDVVARIRQGGRSGILFPGPPVPVSLSR